MNKISNVKIAESKKKVLLRLAKKFNVSQKDFTESMIDFFDVTGVDPSDKKVLSPAEELKKFRNTIISFLRNQEKEFIKPVFGKVDSMLEHFFSVAEELKSSQKNVEKAKIPSLRKEGEAEISSEKIEPKQKDDQKNSEFFEQLERKKIENEQLKKYLTELLGDVEKKKIALNTYTILKTSEHVRNEMQSFLKRI